LCRYAEAKIMRSVTFPVQLDMYEFCTDELKKELDPARWGCTS
jgi:ubiquitin carboxyl-terminal hydrolase 14